MPLHLTTAKQECTCSVSKLFAGVCRSKKKRIIRVGITSRCIIAATTTSAVAAAGLCASCCVRSV
jgi:hypothetical protein